MKKLLILLVGYLLHLGAVELGNLSVEYRWVRCVKQMKAGTVPEKTEKGTHYCLGTVFLPENTPVYETILLYQPEFWQDYGNRALR